jgi:hypothetical protein
MSLRSAMSAALLALAPGSRSGAAEYRPTSRLRNSSSTLRRVVSSVAGHVAPVMSAVSTDVIQLPSRVPQSSSLVMTSWATSTRRRVR